MPTHHLWLNCNEIQFIWLGSYIQFAKVDILTLCQRFLTFFSLYRVRDLVIVVEQNLSLTDHANSVFCSCLHRLHQLHAIHHSLSINTITTLSCLHLQLDGLWQHCFLTRLLLANIFKFQSYWLGGMFAHIASINQNIWSWFLRLSPLYIS